MKKCEKCEDSGWVEEENKEEKWSIDSDVPGVPCICNPEAKMPKDFECHCSIELKEIKE